MMIPSDTERCLYTKRNGSRCRKPRQTEDTLCYYHSQNSTRETASRARKEQDIVRQYFQGETAALLFPNRRDRLDSAQGVNRLLARVARFVAEGRLEPKIGAALCYIGQTLLGTLPHIARERAARSDAKVHPIFSPEQLDSVRQLLQTLDESNEAEGESVDPGDQQK